MTVGFLASSPDAVDEWHRIGIENGGTSIENGPGMRGTDEATFTWLTCDPETRFRQLTFML